MASQAVNLTEGSISKSLIKLAIPIVGASFIQMAYNLTDMLWIGRVGSDAVAAVGTGGFYLGFAMSLIVLCRTGAEINVAQNMGRDDISTARKFARQGIQLDIALAIAYTIFVMMFASQLVGFFNIGSTHVETMAEGYLRIVSMGFIFFFLTPVLTGIFNGTGNSKIPFYASSIGLILNIIIDPIFIFGLGPVPTMGVYGAALATVISQGVVVTVFMYIIYKNKKSNPEDIFNGINILEKWDMQIVKDMLKIGAPVALQQASMTVFSILIGRIIAQWGATAVAVQKVGIQIESLSWMTAIGLRTALSAFVGQNYGAGNTERIRKGYFVAMKLISVVGIFVTLLLFFGAETIFSVFIPGDAEALAMGTVYLQILALSQWFMCLEIATGGAFSGVGKTAIPSMVSILLTGLRVPFALVLSSEAILGLNGVWWSISMSSVFKGIILVTWFMAWLKANALENKEHEMGMDAEINI